MKANDIIQGMCQNGCTEQMGVIVPINGDLIDTINNYFGNEYECIKESEMYYNVEYLYVYGDKLPNDDGTKADFILMNNDNEYIYLYEIENI